MSIFEKTFFGGSLVRRLDFEFNELLDYIYKIPRFLDAEQELESKKLDDYFPLIGEVENDSEAMKMRRLRWIFEDRKLSETFPNSIANSNLLLAVSKYEEGLYALVMVKKENQRIDPKLPVPMDRKSALCDLTKMGIDHEKTIYEDQVNAAFEFRNCIIHAAVVLSYLKRPEGVRRIVQTESYLPEEDRGKTKLGKYDPKAELVLTPRGEKLVINNQYAYLATSWLRDNICEKINKLIEVKL
jgi:hypothetical protein